MEGEQARPIYTKVKEAGPAATQFYLIEVNEGWRSWILCTGMYGWAADELIEKLAGRGGWRHGGEKE